MTRWRHQPVRIAQVGGSAIILYYDDHDPPHFHVRHAESHARIEIETLAAIESDLPPAAYRAVIGWASAHRAELRQAWDQARRQVRIAPIED